MKFDKTPETIDQEFRAWWAAHPKFGKMKVRSFNSFTLPAGDPFAGMEEGSINHPAIQRMLSRLTPEDKLEIMEADQLDNLDSKGEC